MQFIGWMYDIAREQAPGPDQVAELVQRSGAAGYNAVGLYLEHALAYPSAPWAAGPGALTADDIRFVARHAHDAGVRLIPFLNTLGHMEGFIRAEGGQWLAESADRYGLLQICPSRRECVDFAVGLVDDALAMFDDEWVHLGGDEAWQLGTCPPCAERAAQIGKAGLYAEFYRAMCKHVIDRGRRPALWGDMLITHPQALEAIPRETILFDWHYSDPPRESTERFRAAGFDVVCCPSVRSYDAGWCFLGESQQNIDAHAADADELGAIGVLVTTWECANLTAYATLWPVIMAAGRRLAGGEDWLAALQTEGGDAYAAAADILGNEIPHAAELLKPGGWRVLREQLVIRQNPLLLWQMWRDEAVGDAGTRVLTLCDEADRLLDDHAPLRLAVALHRSAVMWVRQVDAAQQAYAQGDLSHAVDALQRGRALFDTWRPWLIRIVACGGSRGDLYRLDRLQARIGDIINRIETLPAGASYRPAFETLIHPYYIDGEQAGWLTGLPPHPTAT